MKPKALQTPLELARAARNIRLLVMDVDGVLTDGGLYYDGSGKIGQRFDIKDAQGLKLAQLAGLSLGAVSGLGYECTASFMRHIGISDYFPGKSAKVEVVEKIIESQGLSWAETAYLGDDIVDAAPLRRAGLAMCVSDAAPEIIALAAWVSDAPGGRGAVREAVRFILGVQGKWDKLWEE